MTTVTPTNGPTDNRRYLIEYLINDRLTTKQVTACYMKQEEGMTVFKDHTHATAFAVNSHVLISVERLPPAGGTPVPIRPGRRDGS